MSVTREVTVLLAVEIGNTNVHCGLWHQNKWLTSWRARTVPDKMPDEYAVLLRNFFESEDLTYRMISGVVIGSVVPRLTTSFVELVERYIHVEPLVVTHRPKLASVSRSISPPRPGRIGSSTRRRWWRSTALRRL